MYKVNGEKKNLLMNCSLSLLIYVHGLVNTFFSFSFFFFSLIAFGKNEKHKRKAMQFASVLCIKLNYVMSKLEVS